MITTNLASCNAHKPPFRGSFEIKSRSLLSNSRRHFLHNDLSGMVIAYRGIDVAFQHALLRVNFDPQTFKLRRIGQEVAWGNAQDLDWKNWSASIVGGHDTIKTVRYQFQPGKRYRLVVSGRVQRFSVDRVLMTRVDEQRFNATYRESRLVGDRKLRFLITFNVRSGEKRQIGDYASFALDSDSRLAGNT